MTKPANGAPAFWQATAASLLLSLLFLMVYGSTNLITSLRSDVQTWSYDWERHIPFVPAMIIPYMAIDLFFVLAPFITRSRFEFQTLIRRITFAILTAGMCFLLMPLTTTYGEPPRIQGFLGEVFSSFRSMDRPYNLCPSLHIVLRTILADLFTRHSRNFMRWTLHIWFFLTGLSTLLTWQHHVIDVAGGFLLAAVCFWLFRENAGLGNDRESRNFRIASYYFIGGLAFSTVAYCFNSRAGLLYWPAASMMFAAVAYAGVGVSIYRKENGRLPLSTRVLLGPVLWGQWLSLRFYALQCNPWDELKPGVWIGRKLGNREAKRAVAEGVTAVLDLTGDFTEAKPFLDAGIRYVNLPVLDLTAPSVEIMQIASRFISREQKSGIVYIHCKIGYSRTAAVAGAWLLSTRQALSVDAAIELLRAVRPSMIIRPEAQQALIKWSNQVKNIQP